MTLEKLLINLNSDLKHEYKHMLFYMHAVNVLIGRERAYFVDKLKAEASSEMGHVYAFAHKIRGWGGIPICGLESMHFPDSLTKFEDVVNYAIDMEQEVLVNYHERHAQAVELLEKTHKHMDIVLFMEEQIEHSRNDLDEFLQIQREWKQ